MVSNKVQGQGIISKAVKNSAASAVKPAASTVPDDTAQTGAVDKIIKNSASTPTEPTQPIKPPPETTGGIKPPAVSAPTLGNAPNTIAGQDQPERPRSGPERTRESGQADCQHRHRTDALAAAA